MSVATGGASATPARAPSPMVIGLEKRWVKLRIWARIVRLARRRQGSWGAAARNLERLLSYRRRFRGRDVSRKYVRAGRRYFWDLYAPGFPSPAFDDYIARELERSDDAGNPGAPVTAILAITRRCPLACEHCCEWHTLNAPDVLSGADWGRIAAEFQALGTTQFFLSGGEPLSRLSVVRAILESVTPRADVWLLSSGVGLDAKRADLLRQAGLTGVVLSLDHYDRVEHDRFRGHPGAFDAVVKGAAAARAAGLALALALVPTRRLLAEEAALERYREFAASLGAGFIQLLEPKAVGHYMDLDVTLAAEQERQLEAFAHATSYARLLAHFPIVFHPDGNRRQNGCLGATRYLYVDTRGALHRCPFCRSGPDLFTAELGVAPALERLRARSCPMLERSGHCAASNPPTPAEEIHERPRTSLPVL